jgi:hypothetical protein
MQLWKRWLGLLIHVLQQCTLLFQISLSLIIYCLHSAQRSSCVVVFRYYWHTRMPSIFHQAILNSNSLKGFLTMSVFPFHRRTDKGQRQSMVLSNAPESLFSRRMMVGKVLLRYVFLLSPSCHSIPLLKLYFQDTYNIRIRYTDIFGVNISGKNNPHPSVIPAELCQVQTKSSRISNCEGCRICKNQGSRPV